MCTLSFVPGHERLKGGALASVLRTQPRPQEQPMRRLDTSGSHNDRKLPPQKELDSSSMNSTPIEKEPVMECPLLLTTLSGVTFQVSLSVAKFDRLTDSEDQVMDYLASVTDLPVFGCVIDFLPIWDKLQQGREYTIVFRDCSVTLREQEQLGGYPIDQVPKAVHVPMNSEETVPEWAFAGVPRLRHVSVESGIRLIGAETWQDCRQLRIVKLPVTVVGIADNAFRDCKLLNSVLALGCRDFGYKAFSECCSLQRVHASGGAVNVFSGETNFGQYLFQGCINLAEVTVSEVSSLRSELNGLTQQGQDQRASSGLPQLHRHLHARSPKALCSHRSAHL